MPRHKSFTSSRPCAGVRVFSAASEAGNGTGEYDFDLFTIGAGSGGVRGSRFAASYGEVVVESQCNYGGIGFKAGLQGVMVHAVAWLPYPAHLDRWLHNVLVAA